MLRDAAAMLDAVPGEHERAIDVYSQIVQLCPRGTPARATRWSRCSSRPTVTRDVARLLELALEGEMSDEDALQLRIRLVDLYSQQLHEPDRVLPHLEQILASYPGHEDARKIAIRLLAGEGGWRRARPRRWAQAHEALGQPEQTARYLTIELEPLARSAALRAALSSRRSQGGGD